MGFLVNTLAGSNKAHSSHYIPCNVACLLICSALYVQGMQALAMCAKLAKKKKIRAKEGEAEATQRHVLLCVVCASSVC